MKKIIQFAFVLGLIFNVALVNAGIVVLQTDFGTKDGAVSEMKGVIYSVDKNTIVTDLTHEIGVYDIGEAAYRLYQAASYWPKGTVFVSVVDPGVGTERRSVVAKSKNGYYFVTPDNGALTYIAHHYGLEKVRQIDESRHRLAHSEDSNTFHGRDVYAYTAAKLASGKITFEEVGNVLDRPVVSLPIEMPKIQADHLTGAVAFFDPNYGNVWTNIDKGLFKRFGAKIGQTYQVEILRDGKSIYQSEVPFKRTFGEVKSGEALLYLNSNGDLSIAINQADFVKRYGVHKHDTLIIKPVSK